MFPNHFVFGPVALTFYGLWVALGMAAALALFSLTAPRRAITPGRARDFCFWMILAGLIGSRIFYVVFHWSEFASQPASVLAYWRGGLMFQGGLITALALSPFFLRYYRLPFWPTADVMAPSLALGQCFGRLGCFSAGCCYGRVTGADNPLAVVFPPGSLAPWGLPLWPTQLMESFALLILALLLILAIRSGSRTFSPPGRVAALYLLGAGLTRLCMEFFRGDFRGEPVVWGLAPTTMAAIVAAAVGLILFIYHRPRSGL